MTIDRALQISSDEPQMPHFIALGDGRFVSIPLSLSEDEGGHWVTMDGQHVFIGKGGTIEKGAAHLIGKKPDEVSFTKSPHGVWEENRPVWTRQAERQSTKKLKSGLQASVGKENGHPQYLHPMAKEIMKTELQRRDVKIRDSA